ncbi:MAG: hypothetical protein M3N34_08840 [Pseudomonadota bacterium]|nr:hypothetical protein [Pseudomonadota bacterium]
MLNERLFLFADWVMNRILSGYRAVIIFFETRMDGLLGGWLLAVVVTARQRWQGHPWLPAVLPRP